MKNIKNKQQASVLFVGGGSLGHITPSLAILEKLQKLKRDIGVHFVCSHNKMETDFLKNSKYSFTPSITPKLNIFFPFKIFSAIKNANRILEKEKPNVVFSKGGYASVPVCIAAKKRNIPIILHESDSVFGKANKWISNWADIICTGFPPVNLSKKNLNKVIETGNPVRECVLNGSKEKALKITKLKGDKPILLVLGGSQGAMSLNKEIIKQLNTLLKNFEIIHITGYGKKIENSKQGYFACEFAEDSLPHFFAAADIAISRAGSNTIAELLANEIPSILVPLRHVGHDHQQKNAQYISEKYKYTILQQDDIYNKLHTALESIMKNKELFKPIKAKKGIKQNASAIQIAKIILEVLASPYKSH